MQVTFDVKKIQIIKKSNDKIEDNKKYKENIIKHLLKAEYDIKNNRTRNAEDVFKEWEEKYEL